MAMSSFSETDVARDTSGKFAPSATGTTTIDLDMPTPIQPGEHISLGGRGNGPAADAGQYGLSSEEINQFADVRLHRDDTGSYHVEADDITDQFSVMTDQHHPQYLGYRKESIDAFAAQKWGATVDHDSPLSARKVTFTIPVNDSEPASVGRALQDSMYVFNSPSIARYRMEQTGQRDTMFALQEHLDNVDARKKEVSEAVLGTYPEPGATPLSPNKPRSLTISDVRADLTKQLAQVDVKHAAEPGFGTEFFKRNYDTKIVGGHLVISR